MSEHYESSITSSLPLPQKLPSSVGVGTREFVMLLEELPSRKKAFEDLKGILNKLGKIEGKVEPIFIVGEWGEGKTTLYDAYLSINKDVGITFKILTSTMLEYFKKIIKGKYLPRGESPGYKLLAAIFASLAENQEDKLKNLGIFSPLITDYDDCREYVKNFINTLYKNLLDKYQCVILYIDEFEDVVTIRDDELIRLIFSGLNEIINGIIKEMFIDNKSKLHIVISVTPPALARIETSGFGTILGRIKRRENRINLPPLSREERLLFIKKFMCYIWDTDDADKVLSKLFIPVSVINPIIVATLGNIAALQKALESTIIKAIDSNKGAIHPISFSDMYKIVCDLKVNIAGADLEIFNTTLLDKIMSYWESYCRSYCEHIRSELSFTYEESKPLIDFFIITFGVLSYKKLSKVLSLDPFKIQVIIEQLNRAFSDRSIIGSELNTRRFVYQTIKIPFTDKVKRLIKTLKEEILTDIPSLKSERIEGFEENLIDQIIDRMCYVDETGDLSLFIPDPSRDLKESKDFIKEIVPIEISDDEALKLCKILQEKVLHLCKEEGIEPQGGYYLLSPKLVDLLYLSPQLLYLDFISDKIRRFDIWRKLIASVSSDDLIYGFMLLISQESRLNLVYHKVFRTIPDNIHFVGLEYPGRDSIIKLLILTVPRVVNEDDIINLEKIINEEFIKKKKPIHGVIVVYTYDIPDIIEKRLKELEEKYFIKVLKINITSHLQLVKLGAMGKVLREAFISQTLDEALHIIKSIISQKETYEPKTSFDIDRLLFALETLSADLGLSSIFEQLFESEVTLKDLKLETQQYHVDSPTKLQEALKYFLVFNSDRGYFDECLEHARKKIMSYHIFGWKRGVLKGDIESVDELIKRAHILKENGYLEIDENTKEWRLISLTPTEKRIIKILESIGTEIKEDILKDWFIVFAQKAHWDTILEILRDKGLIDKIKGKVRVRTNHKEIVNKIAVLLKEVSEVKRRDQHLIKRFGILCSGKERDYRITVMNDYFETIEEYLRFAEFSINNGDIVNSLRYLKVAEDLWSLYNDLMNYVKESSNIIDKLSKDLKRELDNLEESTKALEKLINEYVVMDHVKIELSEIEDIYEVEKIINEEIDKSYSLSEVSSIIQREWSRARGRSFVFYYGDKSLGPKYKFNFKFWKIVTLLYEKGLIKEEDGRFELSDTIHDLNKRIEQYCKDIRDIINSLSKVKSLAYNIRELCRKSSILQPLSQKIEEIYASKVSTNRRQLRKLSDVEDLIRLWVRSIGNISDIVRILEKIHEVVEKAIKDEDSLSKALESERNNLIKFKQQFIECKNDFWDIVEELDEYSTYIEVLRQKIVDIRVDVEKFSKTCRMIDIPDWIQENVIGILKDIKMEVSKSRDNILNKIKSNYFEIIKTLQTSINIALTLENKVNQAYMNEFNTLKEEFKDIQEILRAIQRFENTIFDLAHHDLQLCKVYYTLKKVEKGLWDVIKRAKILTENEIDVYREYISIKLKERKDLPLTDLANRISSKINLDVQSVKDCLISLIIKEIIVPKL